MTAYVPPTTPSPPPFQQQPSPKQSPGYAKDLLPIVTNEDIRNETNNQQVDNSNLSNSQVNVQQNYSLGQMNTDWLLDNFTVSSRHQVQAAVSVNNRGNAQLTVAYVHNFGTPKIAKSIREARLRGYQQELAEKNLAARIALETHCAKLANAGYSSSACDGVLIAKAPIHTPPPPVTTPSSPVPTPTTGEVIRGLW